MRTYLYIYIYTNWTSFQTSSLNGSLHTCITHSRENKKNATEREVKGGQRGYMTYKFR